MPKLKPNMPFRVTCHICNKTLKARSIAVDKCADGMDYSLKLHIDRVHKKLRPYLCSDCGKSFPTQVVLRLHRDRAHIEARNYKCKLCPKTFTTSQFLEEHQKWHKPKTLFCEFCGDQFHTSPQLRSHRITKHSAGPMPHPCHQCDKGFISPSDLKKHIAFKHEGTKVSCPHCPPGSATFGSTEGLLHHTKEE